jgi:hypothetical protein
LSTLFSFPSQTRPEKKVPEAARTSSALAEYVIDPARQAARNFDQL